MAGGKRLLMDVADSCFDDALELDGAIGGGQVLRLALSLSALCGRAMRVHSIRKGRGGGGGLAAQHLAGVRLVADLTRGDVAGDALRSTEVAVSHAALRGGFFRVNSGTAGSCMLLVQVALPILVFAPTAESAADGTRVLQEGERATGACRATKKKNLPAQSDRPACSELVLVGGTDAPWAPPVDYTSQVLFPILKKWFGVDASLHLHKRGFFPKGGGEVHVEVTPLPPGATLTPMVLTDRGEVVSITVSAFYAGRVSRDVAQRMVDAACKELAIFEVPINQSISEAFSAVGDGCGVLCSAETSTGARLGSSEVGQRGKRAETVGREAGKRLAVDLLAGSVVDHHSQDQIVVFMALASGKSRVRVGSVTEHTLAAMRVAEAVLAVNFETEGDEGDVVLSCEGRIPLSDLALDDPSARPGAAKSPPSGGGRPPISYIHIYEDKHISLGIFCMPRHALIPLHNHPGMTVFSRVLYGKVHILSFDWADQAGTGAVDGPEGARSDSSVQGRTSDSSACRSEAASEARHACQNGFADREATSTSGGASCVDPGASPRRGWARRVWDRSFSGEDAPVLLRPTAGGNIHQFTAMGDCAVLDLLTPPYCPDVGRDCTYFRALGGVEGCGPGCVGDEVLLETHLPQDESAILDVAYQGKPVLARPLQLIAEEYRTVLEVARRAEQG